MRKLVSLRKTACALAILLSTAAAAFAAPSVTTGAGYMKMAKELAASYRAQGDGAIEEVYGGNMGQMLAQIEAGNGVNLVISDRGTLLASKSKVKFAKMEPLGATVLVLAWRKGLNIASPNDLAKDEVKSVAYPDPKAAIYGRAAAKYLEKTGLGAKIASKVRQVSTVPQVFSYIASGEMDAGFINRTAAKAGAGKIGGSVEIPSGYPPIVMVAAVVSGGEKEAAPFVEFLKSDKARAIMKKHGVQ